MTHRYIDESSVAERYLEHSLAPDEQMEFEAHLPGCEECVDRLLLAQIFLDKKKMQSSPANAGFENGTGRSIEKMENWGWMAGGLQSIFGERTAPAPPDLPWPARFAAQFKPWEFVLILAVGAALLLLTPTAYYFWELARLRAGQ
jgi:Putative zinc-finger